MSSKYAKVQTFLKQNGLLVGNVAGAIVGLICGFIIKQLDPSPVTRDLVAYPGEIVIRGLQLLVLPVVFCSLVSGSASLNVKANGKLAARTFSYFLVTSLFNAVMGIFLAIIIHPGGSAIRSELQSYSTVGVIEERENTLLDNFLDLGRNFVPSNIISAFFEQTTTLYTPKPGGVDAFTKTLVPRRGWNALGVIFYALILGSVMSTLEEKAKPLLQIFSAFDTVNMKMITTFIWATPVGVASLICSKVLEVSDIGALFTSLLTFIFTVAIGLALYQFVIMQLIYFIVLKKNPFEFYLSVLPAAITGFAVDSSSIAMPVTLQCLDEKAKVDPRVSHFVVPIGVTVNMDGTALFISIASIFIAQMNQIDLSIGSYVNICITATLVSIAASGVPSASLTLIFIVLHTINAPVHDVGLLLAIDWLVDRLRTTNNILGDCYAAALVEHWSKDELKQMDDRDVQNGIPADSPKLNDGVGLA
ncbi:excitatory amino acid transporter [Folsomia candida]|uniref:Amino acid transporter n=1 Tax=Folsomia candida TaxID=158441 RepID=A0A226F5W4_FOLCA|nr:excitatory amino acid transporter [Folsomia candida]OXA64581.1 Excitatory amino acid transporter [Folsomia candida]